MNPPWKINPSKIIQFAHGDSIIDIAYLPYSQLLVTTSEDHIVKFWAPNARPHELGDLTGKAFVRQKPGFY